MLIECVMNVSEGRVEKTLQAIAEAVRSEPGAFLLDVDADADHNRAVFTFAGGEVEVRRAAQAAIESSVRHIDLRHHQGVHPRLGAADVVPFVPLREATVQDCIRIAHRLGADVFKSLELPVYFYGQAALIEERRELSRVRRRGFEYIAEVVLSEPSLRPDLGGPRLHPSAGAVTIGARPILIAFNVFLDSADTQIARTIAARIRESGGGMAGVRALGLYLPGRGLAQVSTNLVDYRRTSPLQVFQRIQREARTLGTGVRSSQLVGLAPSLALPADPEKAILLENFSADKILERRLEMVMRTEA